MKCSHNFVLLLPTRGIRGEYHVWPIRDVLDTREAIYDHGVF